MPSLRSWDLVLDTRTRLGLLTSLLSLPRDRKEEKNPLKDDLDSMERLELLLLLLVSKDLWGCV